jgi:hypothetical protein
METACAEVVRLPKGLTRFAATSAPRLTDIGGVGDALAVEEVHLFGCGTLANLAPLASCQRLQKLELEHLSPEVDLRPLLECAELVALITKTHRTEAEALGLPVVS